MSQLQLKNGQAFLCTKDVLFKPVYFTNDRPKEGIKAGDLKFPGSLSFTQGNLYYVSLNYYLTDNRGIHKNYEWLKDNFERSAENDKVIVKKPFSKKKKQAEV